MKLYNLLRLLTAIALVLALSAGIANAASLVDASSFTWSTLTLWILSAGLCVPVQYINNSLPNTYARFGVSVIAAGLLTYVFRLFGGGNDAVATGAPYLVMFACVFAANQVTYRYAWRPIWYVTNWHLHKPVIEDSQGSFGEEASY